MRITWDTGPRPYPQGVSQGVLFPDDIPGVAWNGLVKVTEGGLQGQSAMYFDGVRYLSRQPALPFSGSIAALTYPDELEDYIGTKDFFTAQGNRPFGFSYRTNDAIHIVYDVLLVPTQRPYSSIGASSDPTPFEWNFTTQPQKIPGGKSSSHIVILVDDVPDDVLALIENMLYGDDEDDPQLPSIDDIIGFYEFLATMTVTDNGNGTFTVNGPDAYVSPTTAGHFTINSPSLAMIDTVTYTVATY